MAAVDFNDLNSHLALGDMQFQVRKLKCTHCNLQLELQPSPERDMSRLAIAVASARERDTDP